MIGYRDANGKSCREPLKPCREKGITTRDGSTSVGNAHNLLPGVVILKQGQGEHCRGDGMMYRGE
jgi:hypothetical protein